MNFDQNLKFIYDHSNLIISIMIEILKGLGDYIAHSSEQDFSSKYILFLTHAPQ